MVTLLTKRTRSIHFITNNLLLLLSFSLFATSCKKSAEDTGTVGVCPTVVSTDPAKGATNIPTNKKITATFNEVMDPATINGTTFLLTQGTNQIPGTVTYTGSTASFVPSGLLLPNTVYTATITTGSKDPAHNAMAANYVWSFTTSSAPFVIVTDPANGASDVALNKIVSATFNRAMDPTSINSATFLIMQGGTN